MTTAKPKIEAIYPLAPQQMGMLFGSLAAGESGIYIEQEAHSMQGDLDVAAFEGAWQHILERHAILRTAFAWKDQDQPLQAVFESVRTPLERRDWRRLSPAEQRIQLEAYLSEDRRRGFELSRAPLMRLALFQTGDRSHQFVWTIHHIVMDGWCRAVIVSEFVSLYQALSAGKPPQLEAVRPYRDYIAWLARQDFSQAERFWRETLRGFTRPTALGSERDGAEAAPSGERYQHQDARLPAATLSALRSLAAGHRVTLNSVVQGVWAVLLSRYSGDLDIVFGTTVSGRPPDLPGVESIVGLFVSALPFRLRIDPEARLGAWLNTVQSRHLELRQFEYCSSGQVHGWSEVPGALPLYESLIVFENYPAHLPGEKAGGAGGHPSVQSMGGRTSYALTFLVMAGADLTLRAIYARHRLSDAGVGHILGHFQALLEAAAAEPDAPVGSLLERIPPGEIPQVTPHMTGSRRGTMPGHVAPRTRAEKTVAAMAGQVLGLDQVGMEDNFFALGGHSLLATQFVSHLRDAFRVDVPLRLLFEALTMAELALAIEEILIKEIETLSEHEAQRLLAGRD